MDWYYMDGDNRVGPVDQAQFASLVSSGTIHNTTLVWRDGLKDWVAFGTTGMTAGSLADAPPDAAPGGVGDQVACAECGRSFSMDDVVEYQGSYVCGSCKTVFFQRVKEGGALPGDFVYGGFWIRFAAKFLDGIITGVATFVLLIPLGIMAASGGEGANAAGGVLYVLISYGIPIAYTTFFVGKFGATPGKMAAGLKIVRPDGGGISYLRAFGRYFAEMLSALIFLIGYIMAAFDDEKRSLHDRICDTRVIRTR